MLSWADIIQLASALAIECCGGPTLPMRYGRLDVSAPEQCPKEGNLPDAKPPFGGGARDAPTHLRSIFYRMGFSDREIVALSGAHTLGRALPRPKRPLATGQPRAAWGLWVARVAPRACVARSRKPSAVAERAGRQRAPGLPRHRHRVEGAQAPNPNSNPEPNPNQAPSRSARASRSKTMPRAAARSSQRRARRRGRAAPRDSAWPAARVGWRTGSASTTPTTSNLRAVRTGARLRRASAVD